MGQDQSIRRVVALPLPVVEAEVARWAADVPEVAAQMGPRVARAESRPRAMASLQGLLSPIACHKGWQLAEQAGARHPDHFHPLRQRATWSPEAVRDDLRAYVVQHRGDRQAIVIVDATGFLKQGTPSAGVARQDTGTAGKIETGQMGVLLASARAKGRPWLDRERYRPKEWTADGMRGRDAGMPDTIAFQTKPPVARVLLERTLEAGVPAQGVAGDEVYGHDGQLRLGLERRPQADGLAGPAHESVWQGFVPRRVRPRVDRLAPGAWHRVSAGDGAQGPRWDAGALVPRTHPCVLGGSAGCGPAAAWRRRQRWRTLGSSRLPPPACRRWCGWLAWYRPIT